MSKMWSTPLRDTLPNRYNSSVPKLQCRSHRSKNLYVTSQTTTDKIPGEKTSQDHRDFIRDRCDRAGQGQGGKRIDGRSRTERLAFWRDEYALDSFTVLQRLLAFMFSQSQQGPEMRTWLTVSATVLYARPFKQWPEVRLAEDDVPITYREVHNEVLKYRDKVIAHRDPDAHERDVWGNELPIVSDGNNIFIPTTNLPMENGIAGSLLELVEILIPMLKARSSSFVSKYLPESLARGAYVLSLEENPVEWLTPVTPI